MAISTKTSILRIKRGLSTSSQLETLVLALGEPFYETDTHKIKVGDGTTGYKELPYIYDKFFNYNEFDFHVNEEESEVSLKLHHWYGSREEYETEKANIPDYTIVHFTGDTDDFVNEMFDSTEDSDTVHRRIVNGKLIFDALITKEGIGLGSVDNYSYNQILELEGELKNKVVTGNNNNLKIWVGLQESFPSPSEDNIGSLYFATDKNEVFISNGTTNLPLTPTVSWGNITGELNSQTDLDNRLNTLLPRQSGDGEGSIQYLPLGVIKLISKASPDTGPSSSLSLHNGAIELANFNESEENELTLLMENDNIKANNNKIIDQTGLAVTAIQDKLEAGDNITLTLDNGKLKIDSKTGTDYLPLNNPTASNIAQALSWALWAGPNGQQTSRVSIQPNVIRLEAQPDYFLEINPGQVQINDHSTATIGSGGISLQGVSGPSETDLSLNGNGMRVIIPKQGGKLVYLFYNDNDTQNYQETISEPGLLTVRNPNSTLNLTNLKSSLVLSDSVELSTDNYKLSLDNTGSYSYTKEGETSLTLFESETTEATTDVKLNSDRLRVDETLSIVNSKLHSNLPKTTKITVPASDMMAFPQIDLNGGEAIVTSNGNIHLVQLNLKLSSALTTGTEYTIVIPLDISKPSNDVIGYIENYPTGQIMTCQITFPTMTPPQIQVTFQTPQDLTQGTTLRGTITFITENS